MMQGVPRDQAVAILTAVHDRLEAAERRGDAALESALAATPSGVAVHEIDGRAAITRVNPEELRLLGYRSDQMIGQRASEFIVMQDATQHTITERLRGNRALAGALAAITASVVGVILNLAVWFALHVGFATLEPHRFGPLALLVPDAASVDFRALVIAALALLAMLRFRVGMLTTLAASAAAGAALHLAAGA